MKFKLKSEYKPAGDQPKAIKKLTLGINKNYHRQTLLGVTGSGKTFTVANVIEKTQLPTLIISHNKTLAAQLCNEFREFFPENAVEYFVSYYDYYQPESYLPSSDTYIEKEADINEEIDRLRHACTQALLSRQDVIIVASVSAIYGLGSPTEYKNVILHLTQNQTINRQKLTKQLIDMHFERTGADLRLGQFRLRGQTLEIMPINEEIIYRFEISDKIEQIETINPISRKIITTEQDAWFFPAKHYILNENVKSKAIKTIRKELKQRLQYFKKQNKLLEYERLKRKTNYDLEMIANIGYCSGIENYSRHFDGRTPGQPPFTLIDYFNYASNPLTKQGQANRFNKAVNGFLTVIDESHVTLPQIRGMYNGDKARKDNLIKHGFRLPSARDNRPLKSIEFNQKINQIIYMSATPAEEEITISQQIVEQIVRPTGLIDPKVVMRPITGNNKMPLPKLRGISHTKKDEGVSQIEDLISRIENQIKNNGKTLVTTLTKRMAEDLNEYLQKKKIKTKYLHSEINTIERIEIITDLRKGKIDVIVGVNLLREGLDIPEVSLVAILDADKEGFLRNQTSLVQTIGRAARNINGQVIIYADKITGSIKQAVAETDRRRKIQLAYNEKHGITPKTIQKNIRNILEEFGLSSSKRSAKQKLLDRNKKILELDLQADKRPIEQIIKEKEKQMKIAAKELKFELAALLRDEIKQLKKNQK